MELLDRLVVHSERGKHNIEIYHGDLTQIPSEHSVDVLIVSAFPNSYAPSRRTLVGALHRRGVSVKELAADKAADLRQNYASWLSHPIETMTGFERILCYEPLTKGPPAETIGDIFRALMPFVQDAPYVERIAMPLVATGSQSFAMVDVLDALLDAAVNWLQLGLPIESIKIVELNQAKALEMKGAFAALKRRYKTDAPQRFRERIYRYDYFISYSRRNLDATRVLIEALTTIQPDVEIFFDQQELKTGVAWQQELFEALDDCRKVVPLYSPDYVMSKVCKEEYNVALLRHRESDEGVLVPIYLETADLPGYMQLIQYIDCRENDPQKVQAAAQQIIAH